MQEFQDREETVIREVVLLTRDYSVLRKDAWKWNSDLKSIEKVCEKVKTEAGVVLTLYLSGTGEPGFLVNYSKTSEEHYSLRDLEQRLRLKRTPDLFRSVYTLWRLINPSRSKTVSKATYLKLTETAACSLNLPYTTHYALHDMHIDFRHFTGLLFTDFYDSLFQLIDTSLASKSAGEYCRQVMMVCNSVVNSKWYKLKNGVESRGLTGDKRIGFEGWMLPFFRVKGRETASMPSSPLRGSREKGVTKVNIEVKRVAGRHRKSQSTVRSRPTTNPPTHTRVSNLSTDYSLMRIYSVSPSPHNPVC